MKKEKSCSAIIIDNENVLLIKQKKSGNIGFPKGHMELGETEIDTTIREIKEETNLDINVIDSLRYPITYIQNNFINKEVVYYVAELKNKGIISKQEKEIEDIKWVNIDDVLNMLTYDNLKNLWKKVYKDI